MIPVLDRQLLMQLDASLPTHRLYPVAGFELRGLADETQLIYEGYACITGTAYPMYGGPPNGWNEIIEPGAFAKTLSEGADVQLLINHAGEPLARTKSGTMTLTEDDRGEHVVALLDPADPDVARVAGKMRRGDIDEMSFAFRVVRQRWEDASGREVDPLDATVRRITEVNQHKGDVSIVNYGANDATWGVMRHLDRALCELRAGHPLSDEHTRLFRSLVGIDLDPVSVQEAATMVSVARLRTTFAQSAARKVPSLLKY